MRLTHILAAAVMGLFLAGCTTEEVVDSVDVDLKKVTSKTGYELSGKIVQKMQAMSMAKTSPIMLRIFKEEGALEVWKANTANRFEKLREYKICAWSGKLGPKVKEGDRQAPEGYYPLAPGQLNPNSSYYLAINTGFPNQFDRANGRFGTNLMIHGACSSSGCYSMTDEQMQEIFALARDAFKGGQSTIQLQALPFRMTAENMARHRNSPHYDFWKNLKEGYDQFEITKRPPEFAICDRKYVFNKSVAGKMNPTGQCPALSTPPSMEMALANYNKKYDADYGKALKKLDGLVWYEPSEAERKAVVAKQRAGRELAYAPTGTSLDAGKLMKVADLEKQEAHRAELEEAKKAIEIQTAALEQSTRNGKSVPIPQENPLPRPVAQIASASPAPGQGGFWGNLFKKPAPITATDPAAGPLLGEPQTASADTTGQSQSQSQSQSQTASRIASVKTSRDITAGVPVHVETRKVTVKPGHKGPQAAPIDQTTGAQTSAADATGAQASGEMPVPQALAEQQPDGRKKPFWKLW
ncbi:murein L,D-transpeptidase YafK [Rhizobium sp. PP-F2F-G20b]|nr:murein L,D-transpeptidase YafK [Rhizobium sp. PP-F2F-G20b]